MRSSQSDRSPHPAQDTAYPPPNPGDRGKIIDPERSRTQDGGVPGACVARGPDAPSSSPGRARTERGESSCAYEPGPRACSCCSPCIRQDAAATGRRLARRLPAVRLPPAAHPMEPASSPSRLRECRASPRRRGCRPPTFAEILAVRIESVRAVSSWVTLTVPGAPRHSAQPGSRAPVAELRANLLRPGTFLAVLVCDERIRGHTSIPL